jgi:hypothetical protein
MKTRKPKEPIRQKWLSDTEDFYERVREATEDLARDGLIVDSGRRRWSERTQRYEIVWTVPEHAGKPH